MRQLRSVYILNVVVLRAALTYHTNIPVNSGYPLVGILLQQLARYQLLQGQNDAVLAPYTNRRASVLDGFDCVFDLEVAAIGGEDRVGQIVTRTY